MISPVLFLIFNRPDTTARVFDAIRAARPARLYVAADGPRPARAGEAERCEQARKIATAVDWPCTVKTLFRESNLGCKHAVSSAIYWFFEQEEGGIVLEDDCLPHPTFFRFCDELLELYRHDDDVALISGDNFQFGVKRGDASYYFSRYVHIWGWASWRRTWRRYDRDCLRWPAFRDAGGLARVLGGRRVEAREWRRVFDALHANEIDTWDYQLMFAAWANSMVSIVPQKNLVTNIGFGLEATHTKGASRFADVPALPMDFPLVHPSSRATSEAADDHTAKTMFIRPLAARLWSRLLAIRAAISV